MRARLVSTLFAMALVPMTVVAQGPQVPGGGTGNVEPVLVHVNAKGKVTDALPAYRLTPELMRLLRSNMDEMIHTPAKDKQGRPTSSQFIINVALQSDANSSGSYNAHFAYVSASPVPPGTWYWTRDMTGRMGLASRDTLPSPTLAPIDNRIILNGGGQAQVVGNRGGNGGR